MFRHLADLLNAASRTRSVVARRYPHEQVLFSTAATILETPHTAPTGWTFRRFLQRRGNVAITNARIFIQSSFWSPMTLLLLAMLGYGGYELIGRGQGIGLAFVVLAAALLVQRRPYSRDVPFDSIRGVQFGSVRGVTARGDIVAIALDRGAIQVVTAQIVPADLRERLAAIGGDKCGPQVGQQDGWARRPVDVNGQQAQTTMITPTTPGPSPWYLQAPWARVRMNGQPCAWESYDGPLLSGLSRLQTPDGETILFVDCYCYVQPLDDSVFIWYELREPLPRIVFTLLTVRELVAIKNVAAEAADIKEKQDRLRFRGGAPIAFEFATDVGESRHSFVAPLEFASLPEILVLADYGADPKSVRRAIFAFDFGSRCVSVMPQRWFNEGDFDFGYQWITRVQRDPTSGQIVGEGIRLRNFRLDASGTLLEAWLDPDAFYPKGQDP